jgi:hypothetical protein
MREIRFRAWDKEERKMWYPVAVGECGAFIDAFGIKALDRQHDPIMQYIGIKDKNGKEIYEGDILEFENEYLFKPGKHRSEVKYTPPSFEFAGMCGWEGKDIEFKYTQVIGNIYENQELLTT